MADNDPDKPTREPYVSQADRPAVRLKSDTPLTELTVRDIATILGQIGGTRKDFWDGKDWQKDDFDVFKPWKEGKELKDKDKDKDKEVKEKHEIKELKAEKLELDSVFDPGPLHRPDPRLEQVIRTLAGMSAKVDQLADQIAELKKERS
jgi:hypothetical protein